MAISFGDAFYEGGAAFAFGDALFSTPDNAAPVFTSSAAVTVTQGTPLNHTLTATDGDGDSYAFSQVGSWPAWANLVGAVITLNPDITITAGDYQITARVSDGNYDIDQVITVTVATAAAVIIAPFRRTVAWDELQTPNLILGDNFIHTATLQAGLNADPFDVSLADSIKATLVNAKHSVQLSATQTLSSSDSCADWANGVVCINMTEAVTSSAAERIKEKQIGQVEIEVRLLGRSFTWFAPVWLIPGYIA